jgi:hypothetical protein
MKTQEDDEGRLEMERALIMVMMGIVPFDTIQEELRTGGLYMRQLTLPTGAERFIIFQRSNNTVWDSFTFEGDEEDSLNPRDDEHAAA